MKHHREVFWIVIFKYSNRIWIRGWFGVRYPNLTTSDEPLWLCYNIWINYWNRFFLLCVAELENLKSNFWFIPDLGPKYVLYLSYPKNLYAKYWNESFFRSLISKIKLYIRSDLKLSPKWQTLFISLMKKNVTLFLNEKNLLGILLFFLRMGKYTVSFHEEGVTYWKRGEGSNPIPAGFYFGEILFLFN